MQTSEELEQELAALQTSLVVEKAKQRELKDQLAKEQSALSEKPKFNIKDSITRHEILRLKKDLFIMQKETQGLESHLEYFKNKDKPHVPDVEPPPNPHIPDPPNNVPVPHGNTPGAPVEPDTPIEDPPV